MPRRKLVAPGKEITLAPVRPNVGVEAAYRRRLHRLIEEMQASLLYWLRAAYKANTPEMAQDRTPAAAMQYIMRKLGDRWQKRFNQLAKDMAAHFGKSVANRTDASLKAALKKSGFAVEFTMSAGQKDVLQAVVNENTSLIKSIASQHLTQVQGIVMRGVSEGRNLGHISKALQEQYGVTSRRANFIARDQSNKATAALERTRQAELGLTQAIWMHSHGGRHPRPSHVAANGKKYDIAKGMYLDGEWVWPGTAINCRCVCRAVIPGIND
jgi:SPP1 gp7 family putative phage head morphogenesis protein